MTVGSFAGLPEAGKLAIDFVRVERSEIEETGEYDLEKLVVRLQLAESRRKPPHASLRPTGQAYDE
jgi:hypothetical protein